MSHFNILTYNALNNIFELIIKLGLPLIVIAWFSVFVCTIAMIFVLKRHTLRGKLGISFFIGVIALIAHLLDYVVTLKLCPDLSYEANPIWCIVVERMGLQAAKVYGLTGKLMLAILSFEFFAYFLIQRESLMPEKAGSFLVFWQEFGQRKKYKSWVYLPNLKNFFAFSFALISPFCFYITFLNIVSDKDYYMKIPSMPLMLSMYVIFLTSSYLIGNYWTFRRREKSLDVKVRQGKTS